MSQIIIILSRPSESRNIGSVCRAMKAMSISTLRIVGTQADYDPIQIECLSVYAFEIWQNAQFFSSIRDASTDCVITAGTTRRRGKRRKDWLIFPEEFADTVSRINGKIAVVFGNERTGLTDAELEACTIGVQIPSATQFGSLNLSHAVQVICYILHRKIAVLSAGYEPLTLPQIDEGIQGIVENLQKIDFFKLTGEKDMELFWRTILSRAAVSQSELNYLKKMFAKCAGLISKNASREIP